MNHDSASVTILNDEQWKRVLQKAISGGFLTEVEPGPLLTHLRAGGLTVHEEEMVWREKTDANRMSCLERFLRTRPSLLDSLLNGLNTPNNTRLYNIIETAVQEELMSLRRMPSIDDRFRSALNNRVTDWHVVSAWITPMLQQVECLTRDDVDNIKQHKRQLVEVLTSKTRQEWNALLKVLEEYHKDLHDFLKPFLIPQGSDTRELQRSLSSVSGIINPRLRSQRSSREISQTIYRTEIRLQLPGMRAILHQMRTDDRIGFIDDFLRRGGHVLGIASIEWESAISKKILTSAQNWRRKTLSDWEIPYNAILHIFPIRPPAVILTAFRAFATAPMFQARFVIPETKLIDVDSVLSSFLKQNPNFSNSRHSIVVFQQRTYYYRNGERRQTVESFNENSSSFCFIDEDDGIQDHGQDRKYILLDFLPKEVGFRVAVAPNFLPVLRVHADAEVLGIANDDFCAIGVEALLFPSALLLFQGARLCDQQGRTLRWLVCLRSEELYDVTGQTVYASLDAAIRNSPNSEEGNWARTFVLMQNNDSLPSWRLPVGKIPLVFYRLGMTVRIYRGRVISGDTVGRPGSSWVATMNISQMVKDITECLQTIIE